MARPDRITRPIRVLCLAILGIQLGAAAALADTASHSAPKASDQRITAQSLEGSVAEVATEVAAPDATVPATTAPAPTTTAKPAPTTTAPAPTTTAKPAPTTTAAPAPTTTAPPPPPADPAVRVQAAYEASVPAAWRNAIAVRFELIEGNTSWASHNGTIQIGSAHYNGSEALLRATVAHEFGHLVAFQFGSQAFNGAAPEGWPAYSSRPEEAWADCVSRAFTGVNDPSHGLPDCAGSSLSWTADWLGAGPAAHARTGA